MDAKTSKVESYASPDVDDTHGTQVIDISEDRNGQFHRTFTPRQVHVISLGSNLGSGLFITTGKALALGGPGNMVIGYATVCTTVWAVLQTLSEMTIAFPVSGNYIDYTDRWVDPALAFGLGFAEWLGWIAVVGSEATFFNMLVQFWDTGFPEAASLSIFLVVSVVIFSLPNKVFAWFEYITSLIKVVVFLLIIATSIAILSGAGSQPYAHHGEPWTTLDPFKNGFLGLAQTVLLACWAVGDQVFIGVMGGEAQSPRFSMAHAANLVPVRVATFYMVGVTLITVLVPSTDGRLMGNTDSPTSPFIIPVEGAGIRVVPSIINAGLIVVVLAMAAESIYLSSRVLRTMAHQRLIPEVLARIDSRGRPRWALLITGLTGVFLTYINLSPGGQVGFTWLVSISSASFIVNWLIISITNWRFHQALKAQNDNLFKDIYAWRSPLGSFPSIWLFTTSVFLMACLLAISIHPVGSTSFDITNFFQNLIGLLVIVIFTVAYKLAFRTPWRDPKTADCTTGRRVLSAGEIRDLDKYYALPAWRRGFMYLRLC